MNSCSDKSDAFRMKVAMIFTNISNPIVATDSYSLTVRATDGGGLYDDVILDITVDDVNDNFPVFTPGLILSSINVDHQTKY